MEISDLKTQKKVRRTKTGSSRSRSKQKFPRVLSYQKNYFSRLGRNTQPKNIYKSPPSRRNQNKKMKKIFSSQKIREISGHKSKRRKTEQSKRTHLHQQNRYIS